MGRPPKGSRPSVPKHIRLDADLLDQILSVVGEAGGTLTGFLEEAARVKLAERSRTPGWAQAIDTGHSAMPSRLAAGIEAVEVEAEAADEKARLLLARFLRILQTADRRALIRLEQRLALTEDLLGSRSGMDAGA
jgi:hypothetical protein